jgi:hypothetical protein
VDPQQVHEAATRSGLIVPVGFTQTLVPMHDSFADFLAALAHAKGLATLPAVLDASDEQRVLFTAEMAGITEDLAVRVARDRPFLLAQLARHDHRPLDDASPEEVSQLLRSVTGEPQRSVVLHHAPGGHTVASWREVAAPHWAALPAGGAIAVAPAVIMPPDSGPVAVADQLWREHMQRVLRTPGASAARSDSWLENPRHPATIVLAQQAVQEHAERVASGVTELVDRCAPPGARDQLAGAVGPPGMVAEIFDEEDGAFGPSWPVHYSNANDVAVTAVGGPEPGDWRASGGHGRSSTSVDYLLHKDPGSTAAQRVSSALNKLTRSRWV